MRRLAVLSAVLLCCGLLLAQQPAPPAESQGSKDSAQPGAAQDSGQSKPSQDSGPGQRQRGQRNFERQGVIGTISAINGNALTVKAFDGSTVTVNVTGLTAYQRDQQPAKLSDFKVGEMIFVRGEATGEHTWTAQAIGMRTESTRRYREGMGKDFIVGDIKSIDGRNLTIARVDGVTQSITVDENTSFRKNGESVTLADFAPGEHVFVRGQMKDGVFVPAVLNGGQPVRMRGPGSGGPAEGTPPPTASAPKEGSNPHQ